MNAETVQRMNFRQYEVWPLVTMGNRVCQQNWKDNAMNTFQDGGLMMDGRRLYVTLAVSRDKAVDLKHEKKEDEQKDKRNLWLAREGSTYLFAFLCVTVCLIDSRIHAHCCVFPSLINPVYPLVTSFIPWHSRLKTLSSSKGA